MNEDKMTKDEILNGWMSIINAINNKKSGVKVINPGVWLSMVLSTLLDNNDLDIFLEFCEEIISESKNLQQEFVIRNCFIFKKLINNDVIPYHFTSKDVMLDRYNEFERKLKEIILIRFGGSGSKYYC